MPRTDLWRLEDGKRIKHWDEFNRLEEFQQIGTKAVRKEEGQ
jgi:predicted SnoaL-like aldol condensation-catalyzing enzyme